MRILFALAVLFVAAIGADAQPDKGYVGSAPCKTCHPDVWAPFYRNPHYKTLVSENTPIEARGCEGCHGPGKAHVEARGGKSTIKAFSIMPQKAILDNCLTCHSKDVNRAEIRRSQHTLADVVCTNCHSIHKTATPKSLLAKTQTNLCYDCHAPVRAQFNMPFKHRVNEGVVQCSDCHNPHGAPAPTWRMSARPRMVDHTLGNEEPCLKCHTDKRGPFLFEHAAVRVDGCESCHVPHGSTNARMLKRPVVFTVCLECHNGAGNFGRDNDGVNLQPSSHNMADVRFRNCTTCHVRIHGSNSDPQFLR